MVCRHCGVGPVNRPRRLCWGCYYDPGVKDLYPAMDCRTAGRGGGSRPKPRLRKLTDEQRAEVRATVVPGCRLRGIEATARRLGVDSTTVSRVLCGRKAPVRVGYGADLWSAPPPDAPTPHPPGSPEKVAVLEQRARAGQSLWHAGDATRATE